MTTELLPTGSQVVVGLSEQFFLFEELLAYVWFGVRRADSG